MTMIRYASAALGAAALAALAVGPVSAQTPQRGGTLTFITNGNIGTFDCHGVNASSQFFMSSPPYSNLVRWDPDNYPNLEPDLALSWTQSADKLSYTYKLRSGVKFHDGSDFSSADVKATYERLRNPPAGVISARASLFKAISSIETPDATTVVFKLSEPDPFFLLAVATPYNCIYSAKLLAEDQKYMEKKPIGTGPYKFVEFVPGASVTYVRNDNYFIPGKPYLDGMKALTISGQGFINALSGNEVDAAFASMTPQGMTQVKAARGDGVVFPKAAYNVTQMIEVNTTRPPLNDVRVRQALQWSLDRRAGQAMVTQNFPAGGIVIMLPDGSNLEMSKAEMDALPGYGTDIAANRAKARALLAEAGVKDLKLTLLNRNTGEPYTTLAVFLIDSLRQIGVTVEQRSLDPAGYQTGLNNLNFDLAVNANATTTSDPTEMFIKMLPDSSNNYTGAKDPVLVDLYNKQKPETDHEKRRALVTAFQKRVVEQAYILPMYGTAYYGALKPNVKGWKPLPSPAMNADLRDLWIQK